MENTRVLFIGGPEDGKHRVLPGPPERNIEYWVPVRKPPISVSEMLAEGPTPMDADVDSVTYRLCKLVDSTENFLWVMVAAEVQRAGIIESLIDGYRGKEDTENFDSYDDIQSLLRGLDEIPLPRIEHILAGIDDYCRARENDKGVKR